MFIIKSRKIKKKKCMPEGNLVANNLSKLDFGDLKNSEELKG